jgi:P2 family phage contractile tail tube protein
MALPSKLKHLNVFNAGESYIGQVAELALPKLARLMEKWRGGGMDGGVKVDMGQEDLELEQTYGGLMKTILRQYGVTDVGGVQLRFAGSYQRDDDGTVAAVEIVVRGRHEEIDMGTAKPGDDTSFKVKTACAYYKLTIDGVVEIEIDVLGMVFVVNGVDRLAEHRRAIGA